MFKCLSEENYSIKNNNINQFTKCSVYISLFNLLCEKYNTMNLDNTDDKDKKFIIEMKDIGKFNYVNSCL